MNNMDHYHAVDYPEPHLGRLKQIVARHPEVKTLFGNTPSTMLWLSGVVLLQIGMAYVLRNSSPWLVLGLGFAIGAYANHALFVMIHDATHNLVFKSSASNRWAGMIANLPIVFPSAMGFRTYHLLHHRYQGEFDRDADLAGPIEAKIVGNSRVLKALWLLFFFFIEGVVRPARLKEVKLWDRWVVTNLLVELSFLALVFWAMGPMSILYLAVSTLFSVGLHPVGGRWIQEHYVIVPGQETYSYYGPLNKIAFNVGFHNEHHDLMMVPWSKLPQVKAMAPEFYDNLYAHRSWPGLIARFIWDKKLSLYSRVVRQSRLERQATSSPSPALESTLRALHPSNP